MAAGVSSLLHSESLPITLAHGDEEDGNWWRSVIGAGDVLSINTEATYRVWLSRILEFGDDTNANQWWKELDQLVPDVFVKVKEERRDAEYRTRLNEAVVGLLGHYLEEEPELAQADADAGDALDMDEWGNSGTTYHILLFL